MKEILNTISVWILPAIITIILLYGMYKKAPLYEDFCDGAKEGFWVAVKILPYLVAIMVAIAMFRASGALDFLYNILKTPLETLKIPADTLSLMITRSLSGSATLGLFSEIVNTHGADSYAAKLSAVITGSSETTFYVIAVYFGAVGIKKFRHAILTGILADIVGIFCAIVVSRLFFYS